MLWLLVSLIQLFINSYLRYAIDGGCVGGWIECKLVEAWGNKPIGIPTGIPFILAFRIRIHTIERERFIETGSNF